MISGEWGLMDNENFLFVNLFKNVNANFRHQTNDAYSDLVNICLQWPRSDSISILPALYWPIQQYIAKRTCFTEKGATGISIWLSISLFTLSSTSHNQPPCVITDQSDQGWNSRKLGELQEIYRVLKSAPDAQLYWQSWALSVFFNFFNNKKWFFCIFYQVNLTGSGLFK